MKRCWIFFMGTILLIFIISQNLSAKITGDTVTGKATSQAVGMNITVVGPPQLTITSPANHTYLNNESLPLDYTLDVAQAIWYNIDNSENTTIIYETRPILFNTSLGGHKLFLYAKNSYGEITSKSVSFFIHKERFNILRNNFNGSTKGSSTNFINYSYENLQNLSNVILEHTSHGKILFNEAINLTEDNDFSDDAIDLDANIEISPNNLFINSSALPNFNKSVTLWLYGLSFSDPKILKDGELCPESVCAKESYSGGILKFNVTHFTTYSSEETSITGQTETPSSSGSGSRSEIPDVSFSTDKEKIQVSLKQGESKEQELTIQNIGYYKLHIDLENLKLDDFLKISEKKFDLNLKESKTIILEFLGREDIVPDLYMGELIVKGGGIEKKIPIAIEIESKKSLFDVQVTIPKESSYIAPGEYIVANITLYNLQKTGKVDVKVEYIIKDKEGNTLVVKSETIAVETRANFLKKLKTPKDMNLGIYVLYVTITYDEEVASASTWFSVIKFSLIAQKNIFLIIIIFIITIILLFTSYELKKAKKQIRIDKQTLIKYKLIKK